MSLRWLAGLIKNWLLGIDFFLNLVILIKLCKIRYLNLDKTPLFPRIQVICLKNWKLWQYFLRKFWTRFLLNNLFEMVFGIFFMLFRSWVINKNAKSECVETKSFRFLQITQDLNKIKKSQTPCCRYW